MVILHILFAFVFFVSVFFIAQLLLGSRPLSRKLKLTDEYNRQPCVVLIPAHNEGKSIVDTLASVKQAVQNTDKVLVVADNCSDNTADICRQNNVDVIERFNTQEVGKGFALQYGIDHIKKLNEQYLTVIVMDADCYFEGDSLTQLVMESQTTGNIAQALYLMKSPNKDNIKLNISEFTWLIKNWVRPIGQKKLGVSCHLQGSGMAFPMEMLENRTIASASIVEDLELGLDIVKSGRKISFLDHAVVTSYFPENVEGLESQRKRWEHGHLSVVGKMPPVVVKALFNLDFRLMFQALDAAIPPTIIWCSGLILMTALAFVIGIFSSFSWFYAFAFILVLLFISIAICWSKYATNILPSKQLKGLIPFILSKFGVYKSFVSNREKTWVRTKRDDE